MKTRIVHTQIHFEDDWFNKLTLSDKYLFIYLFTNTHIGLSGIYKLSARVAMLETGATKEEWESATKLFQLANKVMFYKDWIYIVNSKRYSNYSGETNYKALVKEVNSVPESVIHIFGYTIDTPDYTIDTSINKKYKIINNKSVKDFKIKYEGNKAIVVEKLDSAN